MSCILLKTACEADLQMNDSFKEQIDFPVWQLPEVAMEVLCTRVLRAFP